MASSKVLHSAGTAAAACAGSGCQPCLMNGRMNKWCLVLRHCSTCTPLKTTAAQCSAVVELLPELQVLPSSPSKTIRRPFKVGVSGFGSLDIQCLRPGVSQPAMLLPLKCACDVVSWKQSHCHEKNNALTGTLIMPCLHQHRILGSLHCNTVHCSQLAADWQPLTGGSTTGSTKHGVERSHRYSWYQERTSSDCCHALRASAPTYMRVVCHMCVMLT